jgi:uncharacterized membrane protein
MEQLVELKAEGGLLHGELHWLVSIFETIAAVIDLFAIVILLIGAARFLVDIGASEITRPGNKRVRKMNLARAELGRYILAGLELFIVSDVIHTALSLKFSDLLFLLLLVIIRSITSYFLDRELAEIREELKNE